jgi:dihydroflavonol-4-reductase
MKEADMKVFVTGSTGLLGNNLIRALEAGGYTVVGLVRSEEKRRRLLGDTRATLVTGDMRDVPAFASVLDGCELVFHAAAYFREYYQPGDHQKALEEINVQATLALMREADRRGVRRFVHVGSAGTIGANPDGSPGDEETPPGPLQTTNLYLRSKVLGDDAIRAWKPPHGMEVIEILPGWMWGPGDAAPTSAGQMVLDFLARRIPGIADGGISVVDARDVAAAMIAGSQRGRAGERYIVGGEYRSMEEIMEGLARASGVPAPARKLPHALLMTLAFVVELYGRLTGRPTLITRQGVRVMHAKHQVSSRKAERELGVRFRGFDETLRDVVAWHRAHPATPAEHAPAGPSRGQPVAVAQAQPASHQ